MPLLRSLGDQISAVLRSEIVRGTIAPGTYLREEEIADRFKTSRGPARDALRILENEHLLTRSGRSHVVVGLSTDDIEELYALRRALETLAWERVSASASDDPSRQARRHLDEMAQAAERNDRVEFAEADVRFHSSMVKAAGMRRLTAIWEQLEPSIMLFLLVTNAMGTDLSAPLQEHSELLDALERADTDAVVVKLNQHLTRSRDIILPPHPAVSASL